MVAKAVVVQLRAQATGERIAVERDDGEDVLIKKRRGQPDFAVEPVAAEACGVPEASVRDDGTLRILPHHRPGGLDGFYAARLTRR